jgi:hypothetical protein
VAKKKDYTMFKKQMFLCALFIGLGCTTRTQDKGLVVRHSSNVTRGGELLNLLRKSTMSPYPAFDVANCQQLLNEGADLTLKEGMYGDTALLIASQGNIEAVKILLAAGANVNMRGNWWRNDTPVIRAAIGHQLDIMKLLLSVSEIKATVDARNQFSEALYAVICNNRSNFTRGEAYARPLIDAGADVNVRFRYGNTALWEVQENKDWVCMLITAGVDVNMQYDVGCGAPNMKTILDIVTPEIKTYIEQLVKERKERDDNAHELPEKGS